MISTKNEKLKKLQGNGRVQQIHPNQVISVHFMKNLHTLISFLYGYV
jgi:hypothetical protein